MTDAYDAPAALFPHSEITRSLATTNTNGSNIFNTYSKFMRPMTIIPTTSLTMSTIGQKKNDDMGE